MPPLSTPFSCSVTGSSINQLLVNSRCLSSHAPHSVQQILPAPPSTWSRRANACPYHWDQATTLAHCDYSVTSPWCPAFPMSYFSPHGTRHSLVKTQATSVRPLPQTLHMYLLILGGHPKPLRALGDAAQLTARTCLPPRRPSRTPRLFVNTRHPLTPGLWLFFPSFRTVFLPEEHVILTLFFLFAQVAASP